MVIKKKKRLVLELILQTKKAYSTVDMWKHLKYKIIRKHLQIRYSNDLTTLYNQFSEYSDFIYGDPTTYQALYYYAVHYS